MPGWREWVSLPGLGIGHIKDMIDTGTVVERKADVVDRRMISDSGGRARSRGR